MLGTLSITVARQEPSGCVLLTLFFKTTIVLYASLYPSLHLDPKALNDKRFTVFERHIFNPEPRRSSKEASI